MSSVNFDKMSIKQIDDLIAKATEAKAAKQIAKRKELLASFAKEAEEKGFSLADIVGNIKAHKRGSKASYRNPSNPSQTWAGWGRRPFWLEKQLKAGKPLDSFRV